MTTEGANAERSFAATQDDRGQLLALRLVEPVPFDAEGGIEARPVVLPGTDLSHLDDLGWLEKLLQPANECLIGRGRCRCDPLGVVKCEPFRVAEFRLVAPRAVDDGADLGVADAILAAPGSVEILSEGATDDCANAQVQEMAQSR